MVWACWVGVVVAAAGGLGCAEEKVTLVIDGSEHTLHREAARSASNFVARRMMHSKAMGQDRRKIGLVVGAPVYLDAGEMRVQRWWRRMQERVLQGTCCRLWLRIRLASYLGLQDRAVRCFCRRVIAEIGDAREEKTEMERRAVDRLYVHVARELLVQNEGLSLSCDDDQACVHFKDHHRVDTQTLSRGRSRIGSAFLYFWTPEEVDETLLEMVWKSISWMFPKARDIALQTINYRERLHRSEIEAMLGLDGVDMVRIYRGVGCSPVEGISHQKLSSARGLGLLYTDADKECIKTISQCRLEALVLGVRAREQGTLVRCLLQGEIRKSLKSLRIENAGHLTVEDIHALAMLEKIEMIDIEGTMSNECLWAMSGIAEVLHGARVRMQMWRPSDEAVELLCRVGMDDLEICDISVRKMVLLFSRATGSRLAERLRRLTIIIGRRRATESVGAMPFRSLEHFGLLVYLENTLVAVLGALDGRARSRINMLLVEGQYRNECDDISAIEELENLEELRLVCCKLHRGDLRRALAGKRRLRRLVISTGIGMEIAAEEAEAIMATDGLREVTINGCNVNLDVLGTLVGSRKFVSRLARLRIHVMVAGKYKRDRGRLKALGMVCERGSFVLDTGKINIAIEM